MKKNYTILACLILLSIFISNAQNRISFTETNKKVEKLNDNFKAYKIVTISDEFNKITSKEALSIQLTKDYNYILKENKLLANNYKIAIKGENEIEEKTLSEIGFDGRYFINEDISEKKQLILSIFENTYTIYIKELEIEFYIEPLKKYDITANTNDYIFYNVKDAITPEEIDCGYKKEDTQSLIEENDNSQKTGGCKTVEIVFSVDYSMYNTYNSISGTINRTLEVLNLSEANYTIANGLSDNVHFKVVQHYIVTCDTCNYWPTTLAIYDNYARLGTYANRMFNVHYDLKIHWQNQGGSGSAVGLGSYGICGSSAGNGFGKAVVKNYASNTNFIRCILSHEIGHNFGCTHNTRIMRSTVSGSNLWSAESITTINSSLLTYACLSDCNTDACDNRNVEDAVVTSDVPTNSLNVSWLAESGIDFKVRLYNFNTDTWTAYTTVTYPTNTITYNYTQVHCTDKYKVDIVPVCNGIKGISEQIAINISDNVEAPSLAFGYISEPLCGGETAYFTVSAIDEGTAPIYQWRVNGVDVGTNTSNFSTDLLQDNDVLSCHLTSSAACVSSAYTSVSTTVSVVQPTLLSVVITATETTICVGGTVTLTATGTNIESENPFYSWRLNGSYIQGGGAGEHSGPIITVTPANDGDVYTCIIYDGNACHTSDNGGEGENDAISNEITITILDPCTLSNNEFEILGLEYYPNPVKNEFTIRANEEILNIAVYNLLGQLVVSKTMNEKSTVLNLSNLEKSTYFVRIEAETRSKIIKIIKN